MQTQLRQVRDWAQTKAHSGQEPPWAWYQYMKLIETCDAILSGMAATKATPKYERFSSVGLVRSYNSTLDGTWPPLC
jgi:hypothetical protein